MFDLHVKLDFAKFGHNLKLKLNNLYPYSMQYPKQPHAKNIQNLNSSESNQTKSEILHTNAFFTRQTH